MRRNLVKWCEGDPEEELWVCTSCGAELHVDSVGDTCPACGVPVEDELPSPPVLPTGEG